MRSKLAPLFLAGGLVASIGSAAAVPAIVATSAPLHARPGARSAIVAMIPAGAAVNAGPCRAWCRVQYGAVMGFVPSTLLVASAGAPGYYGAAGYADAGPFGLLAAPVEAAGAVVGGTAGAVGGIFDGGAAYGAGEPGYGAGQPVVAGY
jgi:hypothetical protein